jgi:hypothetical protein
MGKHGASIQCYVQDGEGSSSIRRMSGEIIGRAKQSPDEDIGNGPQRASTPTAANMSLLRLPLRPAVAAGSTCLRCFSSAPQRQGTPPMPPQHLGASR